MRKLKKFKVTCRDLMKIIVCDIENMECMVHNVRTAPALMLCTHICRRSLKSMM